MLSPRRFKWSFDDAGFAADIERIAKERRAVARKAFWERALSDEQWDENIRREESGEAF